jgi:hypothetical protein
MADLNCTDRDRQRQKKRQRRGGEERRGKERSSTSLTKM